MPAQLQYCLGNLGVFGYILWYLGGIWKILECTCGYLEACWYPRESIKRGGVRVEDILSRGLSHFVNEDPMEYNSNP